MYRLNHYFWECALYFSYIYIGLKITTGVYRFWYNTVCLYVFYFTYFSLKDNCLTEFCCFLSNFNMNQPYIYIHPLPFKPASHLPPHPPCRLIWSPCWSFLKHTANSCWLSILHMVI